MNFWTNIPFLAYSDSFVTHTRVICERISWIYHIRDKKSSFYGFAHYFISTETKINGSDSVNLLRSVFIFIVRLWKPSLNNCFLSITLCYSKHLFSTCIVTLREKKRAALQKGIWRYSSAKGSAGASSVPRLAEAVPMESETQRQKVCWER